MVPAEGAFLTPSGVEFLARSGVDFLAPLNRNENRTNHKRTSSDHSSTGAQADLRCPEHSQIESTEVPKYDTSELPMFGSAELRNFGSPEVTRSPHAQGIAHLIARVIRANPERTHS